MGADHDGPSDEEGSPRGGGAAAAPPRSRHPPAPPPPPLPSLRGRYPATIEVTTTHAGGDVVARPGRYASFGRGAAAASADERSLDAPPSLERLPPPPPPPPSASSAAADRSRRGPVLVHYHPQLGDTGVESTLLDELPGYPRVGRALRLATRRDDDATTSPHPGAPGAPGGPPKYVYPAAMRGMHAHRAIDDARLARAATAVYRPQRSPASSRPRGLAADGPSPAAGGGDCDAVATPRLLRRRLFLRAARERELSAIADGDNARHGAWATGGGSGPGGGPRGDRSGAPAEAPAASPLASPASPFSPGGSRSRAGDDAADAGSDEAPRSPPGPSLFEKYSYKVSHFSCSLPFASPARVRLSSPSAFGRCDKCVLIIDYSVSSMVNRPLVNPSNIVINVC